MIEEEDRMNAESEGAKAAGVGGGRHDAGEG